MAFTLRVIAHGAGACVEVPNKQQYMVFFCQLGSDVETPTMYVRFPAGSYSGNREPARPRSRKHQHVVLNGERLLVSAKGIAPHDEKLTVNRKKDKISKTPTAYDEHSLHWLPAINDLAPGHGKLNPAYFDDPLAADPPLLAQLVFTQGRVGTTGVERTQVPFKKEGARRGYLRAIGKIFAHLQSVRDREVGRRCVSRHVHIRGAVDGDAAGFVPAVAAEVCRVNEVVPAALSFVTNASKEPALATCTALAVGKLTDVVNPATYALPVLSTATSALRQRCCRRGMSSRRARSLRR
jgi:hypothetical protein